MHLLTTLLLAHLFADFPLQFNSLAKLKKESLTGVFLHVLIYVAITAWTIEEPLTYWPLIVGLGIVHFLIDALKIRLPPTVETFYFLIDQGLHFISIGIATLAAFHVWATPPRSVVPNHVAMIALGCALVLASMVFCWVWVNNLNEEHVQRHFVLRWVKQQMLSLEQRIGLVLVGFVFAGPTYQWLATIFHSIK
ncbi:MAG: DUF3307 domain-containing protein [Caldilineaceae bacterium]